MWSLSVINERRKEVQIEGRGNVARYRPGQAGVTSKDGRFENPSTSVHRIE
jgi:hypothetical protein